MAGADQSTLDYVKEVIRRGDETSGWLEFMCAPTLTHSDFVKVISDGMDGLKVLMPPEDKCGLVHSSGGSPNLKNPRDYASSAVDRLVRNSERLGHELVGFTNVIDARSGDREVLRPYVEAMVERALHYRLPILNGEFAILSDTMNADANITLTGVSFIPRDESPSFFENNGVMYACFDPKGRPIFMNSDGVGTKTQVHARNGKPSGALDDSRAMKLDDLIKKGAVARVISDLVETNRVGDFEIMTGMKKGYIGGYGYDNMEHIIHILQHECVGDRLRPFKTGRFAFNMSGSTVSTIDESRLANPLKPSAGEYLVAISSLNPNGRSNGFTANRAVMEKMFGDTWHERPEGKLFMQYLSAPSTVFYGLFRKLIDDKLATSVYHMSGGAFEGKLARPLAKHGLYVEAENIFKPDWREITLTGANFTTAENAYRTRPMGNEAFVTTNNPEGVISSIARYGFLGRNVGQLVKDTGGLTGVRLKGIKASSGEDVYYSGK